jgi:predicted GIY-YIG superfamily endonuclease
MTTFIKPYTYIAIHKTSGYFYYGVRLSNKVISHQDLGVVYFTSSKTVKTIVEAEGVDSFIWVIRKEFDDKKVAAYWEYKVIRRMLSHPKILNKAVSPISVPGNWFTNGKTNILGKYCPEGYVAGRTYFETSNYKQGYEKQKVRRWWHNGTTSVHTELSPGPNWVPGRLRKDIEKWNGTTLMGKKWWNNGEINYRGSDPPEGFIAGRIKGFTHKVTRTHSIESNLKQSNRMKLKRWWTNGSTTVFTEKSPGPDYAPGRRTNKEQK